MHADGSTTEAEVRRGDLQTKHDEKNLKNIDIDFIRKRTVDFHRVRYAMWHIPQGHHYATIWTWAPAAAPIETKRVEARALSVWSSPDSYIM